MCQMWQHLLNMPMKGAIAFDLRRHARMSFITRTVIPVGKLANLLSFLKWINLMKTGNVNLSYDSLTNIVKQIADLKHMTTLDDNAAARTLEALGATRRVCQIVTPKTINNAPFSDITCLGDKDGLTLGRKQAKLYKHLLNVHQAIARFNKPEMDN